MSAVDRVKKKTQQILTDILGSVRIDKDGDFVVTHESAAVFVTVTEGFGDDGTIIGVECPMVVDVKVTSDLYKWIATEGQSYILGSCRLMSGDDFKTAMIAFRYNIIGDDVDESELKAAVFAVTLSANKLDDELKKKFGGRLFTE